MIQRNDRLDYPARPDMDSLYHNLVPSTQRMRLFLNRSRRGTNFTIFAARRTNIKPVSRVVLNATVETARLRAYRTVLHC